MGRLWQAGHTTRPGPTTGGPTMTGALPKPKIAIWALVLGCLMFVVGSIAAFGGTIVAGFGGMAHAFSTEMSNIQTVTETWCDTCDFRMSIEIGYFSHKDGDRCTKRGCAGTLHIQSRAMTAEELAEVKKGTEGWVTGTKAAQRLGGVAARSGGLMLLAGLGALVACYGLTHRKQWGRILSLVVIVPALASVAVAGLGHAILLTVMLPVPVLFTIFALWKLLGVDADFDQDGMVGQCAQRYS